MGSSAVDRRSNSLTFLGLRGSQGKNLGGADSGGVVGNMRMAVMTVFVGMVLVAMVMVLVNTAVMTMAEVSIICGDGSDICVHDCSVDGGGSIGGGVSDDCGDDDAVLSEDQGGVRDERGDGKREVVVTALEARMR